MKKAAKTIFLLLIIFSLFSIHYEYIKFASAKELENKVEPISDNNVIKSESQPVIIGEIIEKRTANTNHYLIEDGSVQTVISLADLNYETEDGGFEKIKTILVDEVDLNQKSVPLSKEIAREVRNLKKLSTDKKADKEHTDYRALQVPFDVRLPKKFDKGYSIGKGNDRLTLTPIGAKSVTGTVYSENSLFYTNVWENTDVSIELMASGIKETIILKDPDAPSTFTFKVDGVVNEQLSSNRLQISPAWLVDANGVKRDVDQIIRNDGNSTLIDIVADTKNLQYPISIDPTVTIQSSTRDVDYDYIDVNNHSYGGWPLDPTLQIGRQSSYLHEAYIQFDLSTIPSNSIISAKLKMYVHYGANTTSFPLYAYLVKGEWNENTVYFYNQPTLSPTYLQGWTGEFGQITPGIVSPGWSEIDVTSYVSDWKNGTPNYGLKIKGFHDHPSSKKFFYSKESPDPTLAPKLVINYNTAPTAPVPVTPSAGQIVDANQLITWSASTDEQTPQASLKYHIQLSTNNGSSWTDIVGLTSAGATSYSYNFSSITNTTTALIRIRSYDGSLYSQWGQSPIFTIKHNQAPGAPSNTSPGGTTSGTAVTVPGITIPVSWTFNDPDAGDAQSAYQVDVYQTNNALVSSTNWITSSLQSHTLSSGLTRGATYYWNVKTKDIKGAISPVSANKFIKINRLPTTAFSSYADNQTLLDNQLTFTWTYSDADSHAQTKYQVQGSKDNWATIAYNSGDVASSATSLTANFAQGVWSFRVRVFDGYEWSNWSNRNNLTLPNSFEPNDTFATAFPAQYGQNYTTLLSTGTDVDIFKWTATKNGIDRITLTVPVGKNYDLIIYDPGTSLLTTGNRGAGISEDQLVFVTAGQTYYAKVVAPAGDFGTAYTLKVQQFGVTSGTYQTEYEYDANGNLREKTTVVE